MKRLFITAIIVLSAVSLSAVQRPDSIRQASAAEPNIAYGWNFEFFGGAGVGQYLYDQLFTNYTTPHVTNKLAYPTWTAGVGINYYFIPAMGIGTGAQISTYTNNAAINKPWTLNAMDAYNDAYVMTATPMGLTESQEMYLVEVPLALKFRARPGVVGFTGTLGAKIGLPIKNNYKLSSNGVINNKVYYEKFDLTIHDVPGVVENKNIPSSVGSLPNSAFKMLSYAAYVELGMLIRLHQRVELAITAYGNYYFTDLMTSHPSTALGFASTGTVGEYTEPYTEKYTNVLQTNEVKSLHPWTAGIKIGIQINANRTKAERDYDREQKRLRKEAKEREKALLDSLAALAEVAHLEAEAALAAAEAAALAALVVPEDTIVPVDTIPVDTLPVIDPREEAIEQIRRIAAEHGIDICETFCPQAAVVPVLIHDTIYVGTETVVPVISKEDTVAQLLDEELKRAVIYFELDKSVLYWSRKISWYVLPRCSSVTLRRRFM